MNFKTKKNQQFLSIIWKYWPSCNVGGVGWVGSRGFTLVSARQHRGVYGEGSTYYPRQNGGGRIPDWDGFVLICHISNVHTLAIVTYMITTNTTTSVIIQ